MILEAPGDHSSRHYVNENEDSILNSHTKYQKRRIYVLSAADEGSIDEHKAKLLSYLKTTKTMKEDCLMADLAFTLGERRTVFNYKTAFVASTSEKLVENLENNAPKTICALKIPQIAFVFTGQGAQWHAMGRELMAEYPIFAAAIQEADECLKDLNAGWSL